MPFGQMYIMEKIKKKVIIPKPVVKRMSRAILTGQAVDKQREGIGKEVKKKVLIFAILFTGHARSPEGEALLSCQRHRPTRS